MQNSWLLWLAPALCGVILPCSASPRAEAQTNDWQEIRRLPPGSSVSVNALNRPRTAECELLKVTDSELICGLERRAFQALRTFSRTEIIEIRLEFPDRQRIILGAIIGGAAGGAIGGWIASRSGGPEALRTGPGLGVLYGGSFGAAFGRAVHQHGPVLYKRK